MDGHTCHESLTISDGNSIEDVSARAPVPVYCREAGVAADEEVTDGASRSISNMEPLPLMTEAESLLIEAGPDMTDAVSSNPPPLKRELPPTLAFSSLLPSLISRPASAAVRMLPRLLSLSPNVDPTSEFAPNASRSDILATSSSIFTTQWDGGEGKSWRRCITIISTLMFLAERERGRIVAVGERERATTFKIEAIFMIYESGLRMQVGLPGSSMVT